MLPNFPVYILSHRFARASIDDLCGDIGIGILIVLSQMRNGVC